MDQRFRQEVKSFFQANKQQFEENLLEEAINVRDKIAEIQRISNINLLENAYRLIMYVIEKEEEELKAFARKEGVVWATYSITLAFKLEWVQAISRTVWKFLRRYVEEKRTTMTLDDFFDLEKSINEQVDQFLNGFFISYSNYKDELIEKQRKIVENLSVPIIPVSTTMAVLPIIGTIDENRANTILEKVLNEIGQMRIQVLILDLSGVASMEAEVIDPLIKMIDGISMMGCKAVITGLRPDVVKSMVNLGVTFEQKAELKGTLQIALHEYIR